MPPKTFAESPLHGEVPHSRKRVWVVVPGAKVGDKGELSEAALNRLEAAVRIFRKYERRGLSPILIPSGGRPQFRYDAPIGEADALKRDAMERFGIPEEKIVVEPRALCSIGNVVMIGNLILYLTQVKPEARPATVSFVTSPYETDRTRTLAKHVLPEWCRVRAFTYDKSKITPETFARLKKNADDGLERMNSPGGFLRSVPPQSIGHALNYFRTLHNDRRHYAEILKLPPVRIKDREKLLSIPE